MTSTLLQQIEKILDTDRNLRKQVAGMPEIRDAEEKYYISFRATRKLPIDEWRLAHDIAAEALHRAWLKAIEKLQGC